MLRRSDFSTPSSLTTTPTRRTDWFYAATGPTPVRAALSNSAAPPARSNGSRAGSMSMCWRPYRSAFDKNPHAMRQRRETAEHPFGTLKMRMGATHFLMKRLPKVATEMALHVLAYNLTRVMNIRSRKTSRHYSKVANERSKMHEKADLREANLNGADPRRRQTRRGAPRRGILLCHLHRARHHLGRYSVTPRRLSTPTDVTAQQALSTPFGAPSPLWIRCGYCRQTRDNSSRCELWGPIPARLLEGED